MTAPAPSNRRRWLAPGIALALGAVTLWVYWPVRHHAFINYDDPVYITENRHVQGGISRPGLAWAFFNLHGEHTYWHPLTWVSHMLDCQLFGLNPGPHHLVNVAFHIANALLVLLLLNRMTGAFWRSAMVAGLFALHPVQVDTVAWVAERKNVLSTFFGLLSLWAYTRYAKVQSRESEVRSHEAEVRGPRSEGRRQKAEGRIRLPSSIFYLLSLCCFALGLMCKPALVTFPCLLLLLDFWPLRRFAWARDFAPDRSRRRQSAQLSAAGKIGADCRRPQSLASAPKAVRAGAAGGCRVPTASLHLLLWEKIPLFVMAAAAAFITIAGHRELRAVGGSGLLWQWRVANALVSYVRYLGKTFWPSHLAVFYPHPGAWPAGVVDGSALVLLAVSGWVIWRARQAPYLVTGWLWFLGVLVPMIGIIQAGAQAMADRFAYVPLIGLFIMVVWGLAEWATRGPRGEVVLGAAGVLALGGCVALTCRHVSYWQNTVTLFEHALQVTSNNSCAHFTLGNELADQGKTREAMEHWETALKIEPEFAVIHGRIASSLCEQGDFAGAIAHYRRTLQIDPDQAEALNNLAWLLASCPHAAFRNGPEAVRLASRACELTGYTKPLLIGTLAAAQAEVGDFPTAIATAERAVARASALGLEDIAAKNRELIQLYRRGQPFHEKKGVE